MAIQEPEALTLDALSILGDPRPNPAQPPLADGIHLRWAFGKSRGFPLHGTYLFRREYRDDGEVCLAESLSEHPPGDLDRRELALAYGTLSSPRENLFLSDDFAPRSYTEVDLSRDRFLRFDLPPGHAATWVRVRIGFHAQPPAAVSRTVDFSARPVVSVPNPYEEAEVRFENRDAVGLLARQGRIDRNGPNVGLDGGARLVVELPCSAQHVAMQLSRQRATDAPPIKVRALNDDGSLAEEAEYDVSLVVTNLRGAAITRLEIEAPSGVFLHYLSFTCRQARVTIPVFAYSPESEPVAEGQAQGEPGQVASVILEAQKISSLLVMGGPAALIDLCYRPYPFEPSVGWIPQKPWIFLPLLGEVATAPGRWGKVPGFPYPLTLPVTHPAYPASQGPEALSAWRSRAAQRIEYGSATDALGSPQRSSGRGKVTLTPGSPLALGAGTGWDESVVGKLLLPTGADAAFAVMTVLAADRLMLSRPFEGGKPLTGVDYRLVEDDHFAQASDLIAALLSHPGGDQAAAETPPVLDRSGGSPTRGVKLADGSQRVKGVKTAWTEDLAGLLIELGDEADAYLIAAVDAGKQELTLERPFVGDPAQGVYRIVSRSPTNRLDGGIPSFSMRPLDLLEIASLEPAYAQLFGLAYRDGEVEEGHVYDYIVVADRAGRFGGSAHQALDWLNGSPDFAGDAVDGYVAAQVTHAPSGELPGAGAGRLFALPSGRQSQTLARPDLADSDAAISLLERDSWRQRPPADQPLRLQVWRLEHGPRGVVQAAAADPARYAEIDELVPAKTDGENPPPAPTGWPDPRTVHYLDGGEGGLDVGWYSYRLSAIDLFGRHSALGEALPWHDSKTGDLRHRLAVHLEDRTAPPPPTDVVAWALDPGDPHVQQDGSYQDWRPKHPKAVGLRVAWRWPWSHMLQAPDLAEFRIYLQTTPLNARPSRITAVSPAPGAATESEVTLARTDGEADGAYRGASLQAGNRSFEVLDSHGAGGPLRLRVRNGGVGGKEPPEAGQEATVVLTAGHPLHRDLLDPLNWPERLASVPAAGGKDVTIRHGIEPLDESLGGRKARFLPGQRALRLDGKPDLSPVRPGFDLVYVAATTTSSWANLEHFFAIEAVDAAGRKLFLADGTHLAALQGAKDYVWQVGLPQRLYDVFLPRAGGSTGFKLETRLAPTLAEPVVYGAVSVSAADKRAEVPDARASEPPARRRPGNEGQLAGPATIFRVWRQRPKAPAEIPWKASRLVATKADYHGKSYFTFRWSKPATPEEREHLTAHVFRALDDSVFLADFQGERSETDLKAALADAKSYPAHWPAGRRKAAAAEVEAAHAEIREIRAAKGTFSRPPPSAKVGDRAARDSYLDLGDDAVALLASLPGNEEAFSQITIEPLSHTDPAQADRLGPDDDPDTFPGPDPNLAAYLAELDGRSDNRYLFRTAYVDSAHNIGPLGTSTPPVYLPKVVPPRAPVITKVVGGDREVSIQWTPNRDLGLAEYRVYRADHASKASDIRRMILVFSGNPQVVIIEGTPQMIW